MGWFRKPPPPPPPRSYLSERTSFEGQWEGKAALDIHGRLKGAVRCREEVSVDRGAKVEGEVRAEAFRLSGRFQGKAEASRAVFLEGARFEGTLRCETLRVERGARLEGRVEEMRR
jgi:cytoskeletal protein CcmA (bactofilin family)